MADKSDRKPPAHTNTAIHDKVVQEAEAVRRTVREVQNSVQAHASTVREHVAAQVSDLRAHVTHNRETIEAWLKHQHKLRLVQTGILVVILALVIYSVL